MFFEIIVKASNALKTAFKGNFSYTFICFNKKI